LDKVKSYNSSSNEKLLRKAYLFSALAHEGVVRKDGQPYLSHPMAVADILADLKMDDVGIVAGFLHDVVEDNHTVKLENIEANFGPEVAHIVAALTKIERDVPFDQPISKEEASYENIRKLIIAMVEDIRVIFVKLADRLHNLRTMDSMSREQARVKAKEGLDIFAPIANRLGVGIIKNELEDLGFRYAYPEDYEMIKAALQEKRNYSAGFLEETRNQLTGLLESNDIHGEVQGRVKHLYSIYKKIVRQGINISEVYDYMAFRILVPEIKDCYSALGYIHGKWNLVPGRFKDFISDPKENGYKSLHTSVIGPSGQPFEIQIRTFDMHGQAEHGIAAHWKYKEGRFIEEEDANISRFRREIQDFSKSSGAEFLNNLHIDLYPKDIYIISPKGKVVHLARGCTPLDFAYHIHTDIGHQCVGAKINGKLVPLKTELKSGDRVEIMTNPQTHPSRDWLDIVKSSRAKNKIKSWLAQNEKNLAVERGRESFERELRRLKIGLKEISDNGSLEEGLKKSALPDLETFFAEIGYGKIEPRGFLKRVTGAEDDAQASKQTSKRGSEEPPLSFRGDTDFLMNLAKCCNPVEGDSIRGYITKGKGLVVHRATCSNLKRLVELHFERVCDVSWEGRGGSNIFEIPLSIVVHNRRGMLAGVTRVVSEAGADILSCDAKSLEKQGVGEKGIIKMKVLVKDKNHLNKLLAVLTDLDGIASISRNAP
jgi:GTP diphosphokinase / guanosine-3',5'-bis(diphosphate) 3'-diphosphatase